MSVSKYPMQGMQIKRYLWNATNPDTVHEYYRNNIDFSRSREENLKLLKEYAAANEWPSNDTLVCRRLIIRSHRILAGLEDHQREKRKEARKRQKKHKHTTKDCESSGSQHECKRVEAIV